MGQFVTIHPQDPQSRLVNQAVAVLRDGGIIIYPTDSCYALACLPGEKSALDRIIRLRRLEDRHNMTLVCRDLSELSVFARVENSSFRLLKSLTPGPYTFVLDATRDVPRRLLHPRRKTIGIRVPDNTIALHLLESLGEPLLSTSLILPDDDLPLSDPDEMKQRLLKEVDVIIDGGPGGLDETTVLDLTGKEVLIVREGLGDTGSLIAQH